MMFEEQSIAALKAHYPGVSTSLCHRLCDHPLFAIDRLVALASALPTECVEYNSGDIPVSQDPASTPMNGLSATETVRRIAENKSWLVMKTVERDVEYAGLLDALLDEIAPVTHAKTGPMYKREGFIFISSPGSVTPFHMDPEHNILMQISGTKTFNIYPADAEDIVSAEQHEVFHQQGGHRNLPHREEFDVAAQQIAMAPGDALYVPVKSPHWVKVGDAVSVSLSITWRSRASDDEARLRRANGWLRGRGLSPPSPGRSPLRDHGVRLAQRIAERFDKA